MKKVTLCIPLYNAEKTITRTLESILGQDYPIFKIKIFDNLSTDRSKEMCMEFADLYPFIEVSANEKNLGPEGNFTKCIENAEGDYCAIIHTDDLYEKDFLSRSIDVLENDKDCIATFCGALEIDQDENVVGERFFPPELRTNEISFLTINDLLSLVFKYANFITCPSVVVRTEAYTQKIKFWNGEEFRSSADLDVWLRLAEVGKVAAIRSHLMRYRLADVSYSYRIAKKRITKHDLFLVLNKYQTRYAEIIDANMLEDFYFLELKDQALRNLNIIRNRLRDVCFPYEVDFKLSAVLKKMFSSKWHFKIGGSIIGIEIIVFFLVFLGWNKKCLK
ncbi:MAG: glycosyltransferase family 2 protein [Bacteriovorax sp.]|nr:glycosyltransferase family 2 protein [Bacteriovorax sp.]